MPDYKVLPAGIEGYFTAVLLKKSSVQLLSQKVDPFPSSVMMRALQTVQVCVWICDPSQQNRAVVCYHEKCDIPFI